MKTIKVGDIIKVGDKINVGERLGTVTLIQIVNKHSIQVEKAGRYYLVSGLSLRLEDDTWLSK